MRTLAAALKDFGAPRPAAAVPFDSPLGVAGGTDFSFPADLPAPDPMAFDGVEPEPAVDVDALIAEAVAQAETALAEQLSREHDEALQAERDRHAQELAEIQTAFAQEAGPKILAGLEEMERRVVDLTSAVTARILGAVLTDDVRERSIERLAGFIRTALADREAVRIRVRGSLPLYEELKQRLPGHVEQLDFTESGNFDLSVAIDDSVFETRLAEWSAALAEALS